MFDKQNSRCYGYKLNRIIVKYEVLFYRRPSKINVTHSDRHIKELYDIKVSDDQNEDITKKKFIANKNMGLIEKKFNKKKYYQNI